VSNNVSLVPGTENMPRFIMALSEDITARKRADEELRRSEAYLAEAQRLSHTGSWAWNVSTGEVFWSRELFRIFGLDPERTALNIDFIKKLRHPDDRPFAEQTFDMAVREKRNFEMHSRIVLPDGSIKHVHTVGHPAVNDSADLVEFVGTVIDVTERKQAEEALRKAQAELAHVIRVMTMGELATSIAHEINQPLSAIVTNGNACLRWLAGDSPNLDEAREAARRIIRDGNRAGDVIARIRALLRNADTDKARLDINQTVQEVVILMQDDAVRKGVALRMELAADVPPVLGDRVQLQQVILNLVMNGIEAMSGVTDRSRDLLIRSRQHESDKVLVAVQDSGVGLQSESLDHLFKAFFTTKPKGMGMGLAISRSIVENHGGRLWATANPDKGATFQFTLPTGGGNQHD
jgi:PAS domain S-box-containing protein